MCAGVYALQVIFLFTAGYISMAYLPRWIGVNDAVCDAKSCLALMSYNVLMPNSVDGWWIYKMYCRDKCNVSHGTTPSANASWSRRQELLKKQIAEVNPDILALQEVSEMSFHNDWTFLSEFGFDGYALHPKGRLRPCTFWRKSRVTLVAPVCTKDRFVCTIFKVASKDSAQPRRLIAVVNTHLQAGPDKARRLRQTHDALDATWKEFDRLKSSQGNDCVSEKKMIVFCGDFNDNPNEENGCDTAVTQLLKTQVYHGILSSKIKTHRFQPFTDVYTAHAAPTLFVPELMSLFGQQYPSDQFVETLWSIFCSRASRTMSELESEVLCDADKADCSVSRRLTSGSPVWTTADVERYLCCINEQIGRGSEYRCALKKMKNNVSRLHQENNNRSTESDNDMALPSCIFTFRDFVDIYAEELSGGKYWAVQHDVHALTGLPLDSQGRRFTARFDQCWISCTADEMTETTQMHDESSAKSKGFCVTDILHTDIPCNTVIPNAHHPSDHVPVGIRFSFD